MSITIFKLALNHTMGWPQRLEIGERQLVINIYFGIGRSTFPLLCVLCLLISCLGWNQTTRHKILRVKGWNQNILF